MRLTVIAARRLGDPLGPFLILNRERASARARSFGKLLLENATILQHRFLIA